MPASDWKFDLTRSKPNGIKITDIQVDPQGWIGEPQSLVSQACAIMIHLNVFKWDNPGDEEDIVAFHFMVPFIKMGGDGSEFHFARWIRFTLKKKDLYFPNPIQNFNIFSNRWDVEFQDDDMQIRFYHLNEQILFHLMNAIENMILSFKEVRTKNDRIDTYYCGPDDTIILNPEKFITHAKMISLIN
jgi:hypothetical protein